MTHPVDPTHPDYEGPVTIQDGTWTPSNPEPDVPEFGTYEQPTEPRTGLEEDTRKTLDSGYMQQQSLADDRAKADVATPAEMEAQHENYMKQWRIDQALEHARLIPGVEYPDIDAYIAEAERLYNIMLNGFPQA